MPKAARYPYLKPHTRHISQETVRAEWKPLRKDAQVQVRHVFTAAKRATLMQIPEGPRRREAEFVVNDALRRLEKQLPRMPFPPGTRAEGLNLDRIMEQMNVLEAEKVPLADSVRLLEEEVDREEQRLEAKRKELSSLKKKAKTETASRTGAAPAVSNIFNNTEADDIGLVRA